MNTESIQAPLFPDPIGERFKRARENKRLSKQSVAQQLRLPTVVIDAIENEDWPRLGAPIYVRSYVGSYARLLGLPPKIASDIASDKPMPKLQPFSDRSRTRNLFDRSVFNLTSLVMTTIIAGLVAMLAMHVNPSKPLVQMLPLDPPMTWLENQTALRPHALTASTAIVSKPPAPVAEPANLMPVMGSLAPSMSVVANAKKNSSELVLHFRRPSWVEITNASGQHLEQSLIPAGVERRYSVDPTSRVVLGDADAVEVDLNGHLLNLTPYREANTARFTISSAGQILPPGG